MDIASKLSEIMEDPKGMENLKSLANSLFAGAGSVPEPAPPQNSGGAPDLSSLLSSLQGGANSSGTPDLSSLLAGLQNSGGNGGGAPDLSSLLASLGGGGGNSDGGDGAGMSPQDLSMMMKVFSALNNNKDDDRSRLLYSLKPHLSAERQERVDKAVKLLRLAGLLPLIKDFNLLGL